jgi:hypothetical protein
MSTGFWINPDGLPLQFGTQKALPEWGGNYLMYGENREIEVIVPLGSTVFGTTAKLQYPGVPSSFSGTGTPNAAGIVSMTTLFPLQTTAPTTVANTNGVLAIAAPQLYIDQIDLEVLVAANAGTGSATGLTGIGLVGINPSAQAFVQITPNAGVQLLGACANAKMAAGMHYTWYADGTAFGTASPPTAGSWLGNVPLCTNAFTQANGTSFVPSNSFISVIAAGGTYSGSSGGGLLKLRIRYNYYGSINF